jgi:hypothetical protein
MSGRISKGLVDSSCPTTAAKHRNRLDEDCHDESKVILSPKPRPRATCMRYFDRQRKKAKGSDDSLQPASNRERR